MLAPFESRPCEGEGQGVDWEHGWPGTEGNRASGSESGELVSRRGGEIGDVGSSRRMGRGANPMGGVEQ